MAEDRLDRIERSIEALAEQQTQLALQLVDSGEEFDRRMQESEERFDRQMQEGRERHDREMVEIQRASVKLRNQLNRAVRLSVEEARRERARRRELDDKITQLAAAQLLTEEKVQALNHRMAELAATLAAFLKRGGNGNAA